MNELICRCGYVFNTTRSPDPDVWMALKGADVEAYFQAEVEAERLAQDLEHNEGRVAELDVMKSGLQTTLYNCPQCNRLIWYRGGGGGDWEFFTPEREPLEPAEKKAL